MIHFTTLQPPKCNSWKSTFLLIPQRSGDMKIPILCFSDQNGMTFGALTTLGHPFSASLSESPNDLYQWGHAASAGGSAKHRP